MTSSFPRPPMHALLRVLLVVGLLFGVALAPAGTGLHAQDAPFTSSDAPLTIAPTASRELDREKDVVHDPDESDEEHRPEDLVSFIGVRLDANLDTAFFAHEPFGFGPETLEHLSEDLVAVGEWFAGWAQSTASKSFGRALLSLLPIGVLLTLFLLAVVYDRRARKLGLSFAAAVERGGRRSALRVALERSLYRSAGRLTVPLVLWMLSYVPIQGLFHSAPWTEALSDIIGLFIVYRAAATLIEETLNGDYFPVPDDVGARLRGAARFSLGSIWVSGAILLFVLDTGYRADVAALARTMFRLQVALLSLRALWLREPILSLLPDEGTERWQRMRAIIARSFRTFILVSSMLLVLWTFGFTRAATTILLRSYAIVALFLGAALLQRWFERKLESLRSTDMSTVVAALVAQVDGFARISFNVAVLYLALSIVGLHEPLIALLQGVAISVGETPITAFNVLKAITLLGMAVLSSRVLRTVLDLAIYPALGIEVGAGYAVSTALHYFILVMAGGGALITIGIDLAAMAVFAGALGVGIGFGLQDIARNLISGFILLFGRTVQKGDWITVSGNNFGRVETVGARSVLLRTADNYDLVIPSSELVNTTIINWTHHDDHVRVHIPVGTAYNADPREVREALLEAARRSPHVVRSRPSLVWLTNFGESALEFELLVWIDASRTIPARVRGEILFVVWDCLKERGIKIPFPQRDLHLRTIGDLTDDELADLLRTMRTSRTDAASPNEPAPTAPSDLPSTPRDSAAEPTQDTPSPPNDPGPDA